MGITVRYDPSFVGGGNIAHAAGQGRFLAEQDRFNEGIRQYDASLAEQQRQFDQRMDLQWQDGAARDRRAQQGLQFRAYQQDADRALREEMAGGQLDFRRDALAEQGDRARRGNLNRILRQQEEHNFEIGMQEMNRLEKARGGLSPEQYDQAKEQWIDKHGHVAAFGGEYPVSVPFEASPDSAWENVKEQLADLGLPPESAMLYGQMDGDQFVWDEDGRKRAGADRLKMLDRQAAEQKAEADRIAKVEQEKAKADAALQTKLAEEQRNHEWEMNPVRREQERIDKIYEKAAAELVKPVTDSEGNTRMRSSQEIASGLRKLRVALESNTSDSGGQGKPDGKTEATAIPITDWTETMDFPAGTYVILNGKPYIVPQRK